MAEMKVTLSIFEQACLFAIIGRTILAVLLGCIKYPLKGDGGGNSLKAYANRIMARNLFGLTSLRQQQFMIPASSATSTYATWANKNGQTVEEIELPGGAKGFWIGEKTSENIMVYFPGGGYVVPVTSGHFDFLHQVRKALLNSGHKLSILLVQYSLAPQQSYPTQLKECVEAVRVVLQDHDPSNIIVGGDSAGAALALAVVAHARVQNPAVQPLPVNNRFRALLLISPWGEYQTDTRSWQINRYKDYCVPTTFQAWSSAYIGKAPLDNYNAPSSAPAEWWKDVLAADILVAAGAEECLLDSATSLAQKLKTFNPATKLVVGNGECHVGPICDHNFGVLEKGEQASAIESWMASCFSK